MIRRLYRRVFMLVIVVLFAAGCFRNPSGPGGIDGMVCIVNSQARDGGVKHIQFGKGLLEDIIAHPYSTSGVEGAVVTVVNESDGTVYNETTGTNGYFNFKNLPPGFYSASITYGSYAAFQVTGIRVSPGRITHLAKHTYPAPPKEWNFLVYLDGDNNLEGIAIKDLDEMEMVGSTANVNVLVLFDRNPGHDSSNENWTGTRLYYVKQDPVPDGATPLIDSSVLLADIGERDMSHPDTLRDFVIYCQTYFPATKTVLTLWNHGAGVWPKSIPYKSGGPMEKAGGLRGIAFDDTTGEFECLTTAEVARALAEARAVTGQKIDIINMDACLMQTLEVAYEWRNETDYLVGSEENVPGDGNRYNTLLPLLIAGKSTAQFARDLVDDYHASYDVTGAPDTTYSALSMAGLPALISAFTDFADKLNGMSDLTEVGTAVETTPSFAWPEMKDLFAFAQWANLVVDDTGVKDAAAAVLAAMPGVVIHHCETGAHNGLAQGLSILLPDDKANWDKYSKEDQYATLQLARDTMWDEFIKKYVAAAL